MLQAFKYRLKPNKAQREFFARCFGCVRLVYNECVAFGLADNERVRKEGGEHSPLPQVSSLKGKYPFLKDADSLALANAKRNYEAARNAWWRSLKGERKGRKVKPPKFHKKGVAKDSYTTNNQHGTVATQDGRLKLPKVGWVRFIEHRPLEGVIRSATVSREKDGTFYVSILTERDVQLPTKRAEQKPLDAQRVVGLDMSLNDFYVSSDKGRDATRTKYVKRYREAERRLKRLNRRHSRKRLVDTDKTVFSKRWGKDVKVKEPSRNREKARLRLAKQHRKVADKRLDFVCQEAARLSKAYDVIVVEDLDMQAMSQALRLGKSVGDLGWGMFVQRLDWACEKNGCLLVKAEKWFASSKRCNDCGYVYKGLSLSEREWACPWCGCVHDRDVNAALNLRDWYYHHNTVGTTGIYACGDSASTLGGDALGEPSR